MHAAETMEHREEAEAAQKAEYWRKLYVAMTRAEDELYVTGYLTKARDGTGSWYEAIEGALRAESQVLRDAEGNETALVYPRDAGAAAGCAPGQTLRLRLAITPLVLPALPKYRLRQIVRPSSAFAADADPAMVLDTTAERIGGSTRSGGGAARKASRCTRCCSISASSIACCELGRGCREGAGRVLLPDGPRAACRARPQGALDPHAAGAGASVRAGQPGRSAISRAWDTQRCAGHHCGSNRPAGGGTPAGAGGRLQIGCRSTRHRKSRSSRVFEPNRALCTGCRPALPRPSGRCEHSMDEPGIIDEFGFGPAPQGGSRLHHRVILLEGSLDSS